MSKLVNLLVLGVSTKISIIYKILFFRGGDSTKSQDTEKLPSIFIGKFIYLDIYFIYKLYIL